MYEGKIDGGETVNMKLLYKNIDSHGVYVLNNGDIVCYEYETGSILKNGEVIIKKGDVLSWNDGKTEVVLLDYENEEPGNASTASKRLVLLRDGKEIELTKKANDSSVWFTETGNVVFMENSAQEGERRDVYIYTPEGEKKLIVENAIAIDSRFNFEDAYGD